MRNSKILLNLLISILLFSCAKSNDVEVDSAIKEARYHLNSGNCSKAQDILDDVNPDSDDGDFVSVMASAIACEASYTDTRAILNLTNINTGSAAFLGSFAAFPTSNETAADQSSYSKIKEAFDYLLNADGGTAPSTLNRLQKYGTNKGNDLSMQALLMGTVAMGKFFAYFGNTDATGVKGAGGSGNGCITEYTTDGQMNTDILADNGGANIWAACNSGNDGHSDLDSGIVSAAIYKRRMCEGIVLFNNIFEIIANIDLSTNDTVANLDDIKTTINDMYNAAFTLASSRPWGDSGNPILDLKVVTSQTECETFTTNELQIFFLSTFEAFLQ